jgi:hypothetical protein
MNMETFINMAAASPQASRGKDVAPQLEFRSHRRAQAGDDARLMTQDMTGLNVLYAQACKAWASKVPSLAWLLEPTTRPKLFLTDVPPLPEDGVIDGQWLPQSHAILVFGSLDDRCPRLDGYTYGILLHELAHSIESVLYGQGGHGATWVRVVARFHDMPDELKAFIVRHAGRLEVAGALRLHLFSTESYCALLKIVTQWINDDAATVRE